MKTRTSESSTIRLFVLIISVLCTFPAFAQKWGVSTNTLYWATVTPNVGIEYSFHRQMSAAVNISYNPFTFSENRKWKHALGVVEYRYWLSESFKGHYAGMHLTAGVFNLGNLPFGSLKEHRFEGNLYGGGFTYGYQWNIGSRINIGADIGLGYFRMDYNKFYCPTCGDKIDHYNTNYFGPTKIGVSLIYFIK